MTAKSGSGNYEKYGTIPVTDVYILPVKADAVIWKGAMVGIGTDGYAVPMTADTTLKIMGVAEHDLDATDLSSGDRGVRVLPGVFKMANSADSDEITFDDVGKYVYAADDATVALTDGTTTRALAGKVVHVNTDGTVRVEIVPGGLPASASSFAVLERNVTITHADLTDADTSQAVNVGLILPANARFLGGSVKLNTAFSGGTVSALVMDVGGTDADGLIVNRDVFTGASTAELFTPLGVQAAAKLMCQLGAQQIVATFDATGDNLVNLTAGSVTIRLFFLPVA